MLYGVRLVATSRYGVHEPGDQHHQTKKIHSFKQSEFQWVNLGVVTGGERPSKNSATRRFDPSMAPLNGSHSTSQLPSHIHCFCCSANEVAALTPRLLLLVDLCVGELLRNSLNTGVGILTRPRGLLQFLDEKNKGTHFFR